MKSEHSLLSALTVGAIAGAGIMFFALTANEPTQEERIADFYATETAVLVSPHGLRGNMDKGISDFVLVDVRSAEEYEEEHIVSAINIPAYSDRYTSAYSDVDRIVDSFRELEITNPGEDIIVYCYSIPCMTGRKVGNMLAENGIYVKELGVGWNEWRYHWKAWNHPHEWDITKPEEYIATGTDPGVPTVWKIREACNIEGELGC